MQVQSLPKSSKRPPTSPVPANRFRLDSGQVDSPAPANTLRSSDDDLDVVTDGRHKGHEALANRPDAGRRHSEDLRSCIGELPVVNDSVTQ